MLSVGAECVKIFLTELHDKKALQNYINQLDIPIRYKELFVLRYVQNLKFDAVAYEMNTSTRNVFKIHNKALESSWSSTKALFKKSLKVQ